VPEGSDDSGTPAEVSGHERRRRTDVVPLRHATRVWFQISLQTFGGPAGQIAVMQRTLVDEKRWIGQQRFLHALNYCMLLPGPEAQQLATYTGWLLNGTRGGLIAGTLFVLPGMVAMLALSVVYVWLGDTRVVSAIFAGLAPAVIAIVVQAVYRVAKRSLIHPVLVGLAVAAFLALTVLAVPFPVVVLSAGLVGWLAGRWLPALRQVGGEAPRPEGAPPLISDQPLQVHLPSPRRVTATIGIGLVLWWAPILAAALLVRSTDVLVREGLFFSGAALVTFGGAYAGLAYVAQRAVTIYGWLAPSEMVHGLALAETTPGPLIMVVQFVAFLGAFRHPGTMNPWLVAVLGSLLTTWVTFVPCFLFIFLGAPYVERLRNNEQLTAALSGITAAIVGVIANLATYFAVHTLFGATERFAYGPIRIDLPVFSSWKPASLALTAVALALIFLRHWGALRTLALCGAVGAAAGLVGLLQAVRT
jgi:chromate transporter